MARIERRADNSDGKSFADRHSGSPRDDDRAQGDDARSDQDFLLDDSEGDDARAWEGSTQDEPAPFIAPGDFQEDLGEQKEFLEQFDEDLYNDRADPPAQGNTADVAMGERRFGSDGDAFTEYAHRRPGEDSSVGVSRDPADIAEDDESS